MSYHLHLTVRGTLEMMGKTISKKRRRKIKKEKHLLLWHQATRVAFLEKGLELHSQTTLALHERASFVAVVCVGFGSSYTWVRGWTQVLVHLPGKQGVHEASPGHCSFSMAAAWLLLGAGSLPWHALSCHTCRVKSRVILFGKPHKHSHLTGFQAAVSAPLLLASPSAGLIGQDTGRGSQNVIRL